MKVNSNSRGFYVNKKDIFWPFYLWRVLAPKSKSSLNVFQMLILKLVKAGCNTNESLREYSNLDLELIKYILAQLIQERYLDSWALTETGLATLRGDFIESHERSSFYLVQDALTGRILPRVLNEMSYIDSMDFSEKYPCYIASKSSGRKISPLLLTKGIVNPSRPTVEEMSHCIREHRRVLNQLKQANLYIPEHALDVELNIEIIEENAIPVFIHLNLFSSFSGERMWYLSDPTGFTHTVPELNENADQLIEKNKELASRVDSVIGIAEQEYITSYQQKMIEFEEQAKLELLSRYPWTQRNTLIEKHTLAMLRLKQQILVESTPRLELLEGLLNELQKVLEAWIKSFIKPQQSNQDWHKLVISWDRRKPVFHRNKGLIKEIYLRVGGVSDKVASRLASSNSGTVQSALTYGGQSLKPMLAAMLLSFPSVVEQLNVISPNWLDFAVELADVRNMKAAHAGGVNLTKEEALDHLNKVEDLLLVLENLLGNS